MADEKPLFLHVDPVADETIPSCGDTGGKCPECGAQLESGYGMAGGGMGVYEYCEKHGVITKTQTD
jgi:hypothetical protein